ncbi:MAG: hypothetical protein MUF18_10200 [Fimbriiglobus sp.]|jgi:hypothetical protein|nr:hypothetical protein [Fimbriiglobus sp.]
MPLDPPARVWPYLVANVVVALVIDFGRIHEMLNPDSVIFSLASLYEWRPFFWEQDRVGLLWPLLFSWSRDPLLTLQLQTFTTVYLGLCMPVLFARAITPHPAGPVIATAASAVILLCCGPLARYGDSTGPVVLDNWLVVCNFPGALTLAFAALLILQHRGSGWSRWLARAAVGWGLLLLAHWVYLGIVLFLVPFVIVRGWLPGAVPTSTWWRVLFRPLFDPGARLFVIGSAVSTAAVFGLMAWVWANDPSVAPTPTRELPPEQWPIVWGSLIGVLFGETGVPEAAVVFGLASVGGLVWGLWKDRAAVGRIALRTLPVWVAAVAEFGFLGTRFWVENNSYHPRYLVALGSGVVLSVLLIALTPVFSRWRVGRWGGVSAVGLLVVAVGVRFGIPGLGVPRQGVEVAAESYGHELAGLTIDGVAGDYLRTWPVVFHANVVRRERGEPEVWGVSFRAGPLRQRWADVERTYRVAVTGEVGDDFDHQLRMADYWAAEYGLERMSETPLVRTERTAVYQFRVVGR